MQAVRVGRWGLIKYKRWILLAVCSVVLSCYGFGTGFILDQKHEILARILVATGNFIAHGFSGCALLYAFTRANSRTDPTMPSSLLIPVLTIMAAIISGVLLCLQHMTSFLLVSSYSWHIDFLLTLAG
jgi:hypothetical protein